MCGIAGIARRAPGGVRAEMLTRMAGALRHRGPDGFGLYTGRHVGLAHTRLSIVDLEHGAQPMTNEDGRVVVTFNGEIFNHVELRAELARAGHRFRTRADTEVLVHGYEQWGVSGLLPRLNGQFAFALYDRRPGTLLLARDRFGILPLVHTTHRGDLYFASEAKALFASGEVEAAIDPQGLDEVFTFWAARPPRTPFAGVRALEPGCAAIWAAGTLRHVRWYRPEYADPRQEPADALELLDDALRDAVALRMRADVPVGAYLSGGLDSTVVTALAARRTPHPIRTFSVTFADPEFDERPAQREAASTLGTIHSDTRVSDAEIAAVFPDVVWHAETPLLRTAPAPLFLLSRLAREQGISVVLTGEGADETFLGYDLFKEVVVREFCMRQPQSTVRPRLFDRLYPYLAGAARRNAMWRRFFLIGTPGEPLFSHLPRFALASWTKQFYSPDLRAAIGGFDPLAELVDTLPPAFGRWSSLDRAAYLECITLLEPYILSTQGDRMMMAHGVEGRPPFLDHRVAELAAALPTGSKLRGLREKDILRRWAAGVLPHALATRPKQPYRAPGVPAFFGRHAPAWVRALLEPAALQRSGLFDAGAVAGLVRRCAAGRATGERETQAMVAVLSTQLWHEAFLEGAAAAGYTDMPRPDVDIREDVAPAAVA